MGRALPTLTDTRFAHASIALAMLMNWPDAAAGTADEPAFDEEIVVTGSRIRRDALTARDSVLAIEAEDGDRTGLTSLGEMLARLSVSGAPLTTRFNSSGNFGFPADGGGVAAGASQVDLRHLGSKRVLVLVDGVRWVNGSSGSGVSGATDLNTIPASVVQRVEVLRDGASAIYGSDAIAGVVNVITRGASGFSASVYGGSYEAGGETTDLELSLGGERRATSASLHLSHTNQKRVSAADHELTRWPKPGTGVTHGSTFTPQGRIIFTDPNTGAFVNCALNDGVTGSPVYDPADPCGPNDDYHPWTNADRFNYASYNLTLTPSERTGVFGRLEHHASDRLRVYARAFLNRRESINQAAPEPVWAGTLIGTGSLMDAIAVDAASPYNPFGFDVGPGALVTRRPLESGPRVFQQDVETRYLAAGAEGERTVLGRSLYWDANLAWSKNAADQTKNGAHNARKMLQALGPPEACARIPGCVPLNLFGGQGSGGGTITPEMLAWIGFVQRDYSEQSLKSFTFNVTGDLAELPAGPMAFATGIERRSQEGRFDPDPVVSAGDTAGLPAQPTAGAFDVTEWYAEVEAPLVSGARGADMIDLSAAIRYFDYSTFDSGTTAKIGMRWEPVPGVLFRAARTEGFRAPNIGELFGGLTRLDAAISDPCAGFLTTDVGQTVIDNCVAEGVPADGSYTQLGGQLSVMTGGNALLEPETSRSYTVAIAWRPGWALDADWIDDLRFEVARYAHGGRRCHHRVRRPDRAGRLLPRRHRRLLPTRPTQRKRRHRPVPQHPVQRRGDPHRRLGLRRLLGVGVRLAGTVARHASGRIHRAVEGHHGCGHRDAVSRGKDGSRPGQTGVEIDARGRLDPCRLERVLDGPLHPWHDRAVLRLPGRITGQPDEPRALHDARPRGQQRLAQPSGEHRPPRRSGKLRVSKGQRRHRRRARREQPARPGSASQPERFSQRLRRVGLRHSRRTLRVCSRGLRHRSVASSHFTDQSNWREPHQPRRS